MSTFNIDEEIDKLVDKFSDQLRSRLKKMVERSEKQVLRQYMASQKETSKVVKPKESKKRELVVTKPQKVVVGSVQTKKGAPHKREAEYGYSSSESEYDSDNSDKS